MNTLNGMDGSNVLADEREAVADKEVGSRSTIPNQEVTSLEKFEKNSNVFS